MPPSMQDMERGILADTGNPWMLAGYVKCRLNLAGPQTSPARPRSAPLGSWDEFPDGPGGVHVCVYHSGL